MSALIDRVHCLFQVEIFITGISPLQHLNGQCSFCAVTFLIHSLPDFTKSSARTVKCQILAVSTGSNDNLRIFNSFFEFEGVNIVIPVERNLFLNDVEAFIRQLFSLVARWQLRAKQLHFRYVTEDAADDNL